LTNTAMSVPVKFQLNEDVRRIKVPKQISFPEVVTLLKSLFKLPETDWENLSLKYTDNENDKCTITCEQELREAFLAKKDEVLRLELTFPAKKIDIPQQQPFPGIFRCPYPRRSEFIPMQPTQVPLQPLQSPPQEARRCWPERMNQRRMQMFGLNEEGLALMDAQKYQEAKDVFAKLAEMFNCPWKKSVPYYNIACCEALLGNVDSAVAFLSKAVSCGYRNVLHMEQDKDLDSLRGLEAFDILMDELRAAPVSEKRKECRFKARFQNHFQRPQDEKVPEVKQPEKEAITEPCQVFSAVTGEVVAEITPSQPEITLVQPEIITFVPLEEVKVDTQVQKTEVKREPAKPEAREFEAELVSLMQMGFTNERKNFKVLRRTRGNLSEAVVLLLR